MLVGCISEKMASYFSRWIHALGIDAGCVALLGYLLVCRVANVPANLGYGWVLLITVVLAYMGDRWLDASRQPLFSMTLPRHGIYVRHRFMLFRLWCILFTVDLIIAFSCLSPQELALGVCFAGGVGAYTIFAQRGKLRRGSKEVCIGGLFFLGALGLSPWELEMSGWWTALLFGLLCSFDCLVMAYLERHQDNAREEPSAFSFTIFNQRFGWRIMWLMIVVWLFSLFWVPIILILGMALFVVATLVWARRLRLSNHSLDGQKLDAVLIVFLISLVLLI